MHNYISATKFCFTVSVYTYEIRDLYIKMQPLMLKWYNTLRVTRHQAKTH